MPMTKFASVSSTDFPEVLEEFDNVFDGRIPLAKRPAIVPHMINKINAKI